MPMHAWLRAWLVALLVMGALDAVWLGWAMRGYYVEHLGPMLADPVPWLPALLFYLMFPAGLLALALTPRPATAGRAAWRCALYGAVTYATYDLTNWATLRGWPPLLVLIDIVWGVVIATASGLAAWRVGAGRGQAAGGSGP